MKSLVTIPGDPVPQGSVRPMVNRKTGGTFVKYSPQVIAWRTKVTAYAREAIANGEADKYPAGDPLVVALTFVIRRPEHHWGMGKNKNRLKASSPSAPTGSRGDLDKLVRAILDGFTDAGVWADDGQVTTIIASKMYAVSRSSQGHCVVSVTSLVEDPDVCDDCGRSDGTHDLDIEH